MLEKKDEKNPPKTAGKPLCHAGALHCLCLASRKGINAQTRLALRGNGTYNINAIDAIYSRVGVLFGQDPVYDTFTINTNGCITVNTDETDINSVLQSATVTGFVRLITEDSEGGKRTNKVVCGNLTQTGAVELVDGEMFSFQEDAHLTIPTGASVDLAKAITFTIPDGSITNYGTLYLPASVMATTIPALNIALQPGAVIKIPTETPGEYTTYNNDGSLVTDTTILTLTDVEQSTADFTWLKNADGSYTLTVLNNLAYEDIEVLVPNATIQLTKDTTLGSISMGGADPANLIPCNLTIAGGYSLTIQKDPTALHTGIGGVGSLTVAEGTTVDLTMVMLQSWEASDGTGTQYSSMVLDGTLLTNFMLATDLTISSTGRLQAEADPDLTANNPELGVPFRLTKEAGHPIMTLGAGVQLLSPEGATYVMLEDQEGDPQAPITYYTGLFQMPDGTPATSIIIGAKPASEGGSSGGSVTVTPAVTPAPTATPAVPVSPATGETPCAAVAFGLMVTFGLATIGLFVKNTCVLPKK